ncbi:MAG: pyrroloquinoline quinone biosynthesis protein PqqB [Alphaproteobacteria bacterium]|nr:pyrroloquinoline quinone biosynthesis protein PqqB [Alphaproteobacteria bacterium]
MHILVLGAAAGGGFPQWNCNCAACRRARAGDPLARKALQASIAVSADAKQWFLINASPDLRQQIAENPSLHPKNGALRGTPVAGVVLTNGDVDAVCGLLNLREGTSFTIYAHQRVMRILDENTIFSVLNPALVKRRPLALDRAQSLDLPDSTKSGLEIIPFAVPGKVALYLERAEEGPSLGSRDGDVIGVEVRAPATGKRFIFVGNCSAFTPALERRLKGVPLVFFDGTLWSDDEMIRAGMGHKTGGRMGHLSMSGPNGTIAAFERLGVARKLFLHINNSNPALLADSPERQQLERAGWEVPKDGMEIAL